MAINPATTGLRSSATSGVNLPCVKPVKVIVRVNVSMGTPASTNCIIVILFAGIIIFAFISSKASSTSTCCGGCSQAHLPGAVVKPYPAGGAEKGSILSLS